MVGTQNSDWGPHLWQILHVCAETLGRQSHPVMAADEARAWIQLLRDTEGAMPCAMCRGHYRAWRKDHPLEEFQGMRGELLRSRGREWLWLLHEAVNDRREVSAEERVPFDMVEDRYSSTEAKEAARRSIDVMTAVHKEAMPLRLVDGTAVREWRGRLSVFRRLVGWWH